MGSTMDNPNFVIVGAGPVSLLLANHLALLLKQYNIDKKILIVEKYPDYRRDHTLRVEEDSINHEHLSPELRDILQTFVGRTKTLDIEKQLKAFAIGNGIEFLYEEVKDCQALAEKYPTAEYIIGADGTHSVVRSQIFNHELDLDSDLQHILQVTYQTQNRTQELSLWQTGYQVLQANHLVNEFVKPGETGSSVSLQIVLSQEEHELLAPFAKAKDKIRIDDPRIPTKVKETIDRWINARHEALGDVITENSAKISAVKLSVYASKDIIKETTFGPESKQKWILCGDSLFGVPYFRSLNNGWKCALNLGYSLLLECLGRQYELESSSKISSSLYTPRPQEPLLQYEHFVRRLVGSEAIRAKVKAVKFNALDTTVGSSRASIASAKHLKMKSSQGSTQVLSFLYNAATSIPSLASRFLSTASSYLASHAPSESDSESTVTLPCSFRKTGRR